ncbi:ABC transporter permease [Croceivirga thetidis]|uniref:ABC transporter permease n=1 Tax=Croceivirga thetidis TaxID=2721623 RepID=A0ABX1GST8_9FLAO|nr:ABC transporter permease [Croceivirga thetidis]NKI32986.1 ABC transporter permease [Croceivirga thetidis]
MKKLKLIIKREYLAKVRNRSFVIMTFLSPVLMVGMVVLIAYLTKLNDSEKRVIAVLNESEFFSESFNPRETLSFLQFENIDLKTAKDSTNSSGFYGLLHIPSYENLETVADSTVFYSVDSPISEVLSKVESVFEIRLREHRLQSLGLSKEEFTQIQQDYTVSLATFEGERNLMDLNIIRALVGGGFGYLIMMFIIIYGGFVMRSVIEEKTTRIIEVIISSVKPFQLMLGKIIGTSLAGVTQFTIWVVAAGILLVIALAIFGIDPMILLDRSNIKAMTAGAARDFSPDDFEKIKSVGREILRIPWFTLIASFLIYFVLGYLIYSSIYAAIGAAVDNETDTQQFIFPIILPLMLAIYVGFFSVFSNPHGPIAVGFSLFPLTSPIVMLMRLPGGIGAGGVPIWQFVLSIALLVVTFMAIVWLAAKIYRVGILMYGKKPSYKELYKWLKY